MSGVITRCFIPPKLCLEEGWNEQKIMKEKRGRKLGRGEEEKEKESWKVESFEVPKTCITLVGSTMKVSKVPTSRRETR